MSQPLIIAVPSKGRLEENVAKLFLDAGMPLKRDGARGYKGTLRHIQNVEISYLSASEIANRLKEGAVHFGVTGEDLLREEVPDLDSSIALVKPLGFGHADVVVAIPDAWIDVTHMTDIAEVASEYRQKTGTRMRVATKYIHLAQDFFAQHGITDYTIVRSFGATEGAPSSGAAEIIVDITSTGATLVANQLRIPDDGTILKSEANLAASLTADWSPMARAAARDILHRIEARQRATDLREIQFDIQASDKLWLDTLIADYGIQLLNAQKSDGMITLLAQEQQVSDITQVLHQRGKTTVSVRVAEYIFAAQTESYDKLMTRITS